MAFFISEYLSCRPSVRLAKTKALPPASQGSFTLSAEALKTHSVRVFLRGPTLVNSSHHSHPSKPRQGFGRLDNTPHWISRSTQQLFTRPQFSKTAPSFPGTPPYYRAFHSTRQIRGSSCLSALSCLTFFSTRLITESPSLSIVFRQAPPSANG